MAGSALGIDGRWVAAKRGFLFPVKALPKVFRGKFVAVLKAARQVGKLQEAGRAEHAWRGLLAQVHRHDWVVYAKEPLGGPVQVIEYLGRYTHRVAISNERILNISADTVRMRVRDSAHGNRKHATRLPAQTFIERFLTHVLPKGFKRIRHYGLIGPAHKAARLAAARGTGRARDRSDRGGVGRSLYAPHRAARALALRALRHGQVRAHGAHRRCAAALAISAGPAVTDPMLSRFLCRAFGGGIRHGCARPVGPVRPIQAFARPCSGTSPSFLCVANACVPLIGRLHRHVKRLTPAPARLQSP
jgi:Putative transposase